MKRLFLLIIAFPLALGLCSCGEEKFEPVPSTEEEARVVMTLTSDGKVYEIKYELYRALFIGNREKVDGGDTSVWSGESASEYVNEINAIIVDRAAEIYGAFHLAKSIGIDPYSAEANEAVQETIGIYVHGSDSQSNNSTTVIGYGSYEKYLEALASRGMNYAVGDLMMRYSYLMGKINEYYIGEYDPALGYTGGHIQVTDEKLSEYYGGDSCVRILEAYFQEGTKTEERVEEIRNKIASESSTSAMAAKIIQYTTSDYTELLDSHNNPVGKIVGRYELDDFYFNEYTGAAFSVDDGEVSDIIHITDVNDSYTDGYYVLVGLSKTDSYFESYKDKIKESYVNNEIGKIIYDSESSLASGAAYLDGYSQIIHSEIVK